MTRRYDDVVEVRSRTAQVSIAPTAGAGPAAEPEAFCWRGRIYRVREVLGHWYERRSWWTEQAARAVHGDGPDSAGARGTGAGAPSADREVWRVEASAGRSAATGVYDLCRDDALDRPWRLLRGAD